jgi:hypothetical protein
MALTETICECSTRPKRIEIIYFSKGMTEVIMISPKDREAFLEELNKKISSMKPH